MDEKTLAELKQALEKEKRELTEELASFANPDKTLAGDWDTRYPNMGGDDEDNAQEVTEYATNVPIEHRLELELRDVNNALEKIAAGQYGFCEKCGAAMDIERLKAEPSARSCVQHN